MSAFIYRRERERGNAEKRVRKIHDAEAERRVLTAEANGMRQRIEAVANVRVQADAERQAARLLRLKSAETRESITRQLERLKMRALGRRLASSSETTHYLLGHLLSEKECLVCGANPSPAASTIDSWVRAGRCPLCGSEHETVEKVVPLSSADRTRIARLESELAYADRQIADADARIADAQQRFATADAEYAKLEQDRLALDLRIVAVLKKIPSERAAIGTANDDIDTLNRLLADERRQLATAEGRFRAIIEETVRAVEALQEAIAAAFQRYLKLFIREDASLVYQTTKARLGQSGELFDFPTFRLAMTGGAVAGATMRTGPDAVSQSQGGVY
jgi:DNA repair exonuclease SbcCD ATPase subunit